VLEKITIEKFTKKLKVLPQEFFACGRNKKRLFLPNAGLPILFTILGQ
jgi:hypothetical protein